VVRCHTTQIDQITIIKSLFRDFGRVTTSLNNGHYHINCFLNNTFDFLLSKKVDSWEWLKDDDELVLNFTAGYVDAEANFILNQNRARFKIDSYDVEILTFISEWLVSQGIQTRFRRIYKKGDIWKGNFPLNKDLWRLNINDMVSLLKFINLLLPLIRHKKRRKDMMICLKNIKDRQNKKYHGLQNN
jgi:intein/homing endonuclease